MEEHKKKYDTSHLKRNKDGFLVGTNNPELYKMAEGKRTGPKTKWGQLRKNVSRIKGVNNTYADHHKYAKSSMLRKLVVDAGCPLGVNCPECNGNTPERGCKLRFKLFVEAIGKNDIDIMTEIHELLVTVKIELGIELKKLHDKNESPGKNLLSLLKIYKDLVMETHKAKHGVKVNANIKHEVTYEDIRDKMFEEEKQIVHDVEGEPVGEVLIRTKKKKKQDASHS